jgi:hypothetical protein
MAERDSKVAFDSMIQSYLDGFGTTDKQKVPELEVRFGTGNMVRPTTKIDSDNVVRQLLRAGFKSNNNEGQHLLRVTPETTYINKKTNVSKKSKIRLEIVGINMIQSYCKCGEDLSETVKLVKDNIAPDELIKFTLKSDAQVNIPSIIFKDLGFNVSYQIESNSSPNNNINAGIMSEWNNLKKTFRFMNRVKFTHKDYPINADISIIKTSKKEDRIYKSEYTMKDAGIFDNEETYEIELELDNEKAKKMNKKDLLDCLRKCIRIVMSGLQQSNYPIGHNEKTLVLDSYMKIVNGNNYKELTNKFGYTVYRGIETKHFIGPNSMTLQINNIIPENQQMMIPNIHKNYCVTDKADGMRTLLYIADNGRLYLIDMNMNVMFTGSITKNERFKNSILDGENIKHRKGKPMMNLFASFDIYYLHGKYVGGYDFKTFDVEGAEKKTCRHDLLTQFIKELELESVINIYLTASHFGPEGCEFTISCKRFVFTENDKTIFQASKEIDEIDTDDYEKDGLIFTPSNTGVGNSKEPFKTKFTWKESFKWKPPQHNTIDFLVKIKDETRNIFQDGNNLQNSGQGILKYKTLELLCGFSESDGFREPMLTLLDDKPTPSTKEYRPVSFYPTNPVDKSACFCNILTEDDVIRTEQIGETHGEIIEDYTIVEFKYVKKIDRPTDDNAWNWVPIRNRHDKTAELRNAMRDKLLNAMRDKPNNKQISPNYGNSFKVADSNWTSIHYPVDKSMITTGTNIPEKPVDSGVYYNNGDNTETNTKGLREFHNLYVKFSLIEGVGKLLKTKKNTTLIDYAVGKGGDLSKWAAANISFVFGIDVSKDNIENQKDGAYSRYLGIKDKLNVPKVLFVVGDSGKNIKDNTAYGKDNGNDSAILISEAIFGTSRKEDIKWKPVIEQFSVAKEGFDVSSIQFAIHYFFKDFNSVHQFVRNVSECTCLNGYFIGTCYDGKTVFDILSKQNSKIIISTKATQKKMLEITQKYSQTGFTETEPCLGYEIDVWQESINQTFSEYLVNFEYLKKIMTNYGFELVTQDVAQQMGLPKATGLFKDLFDSMCKSNKKKINNREYGTAANMTEAEKKISFMNRFFVFQKKRVVETKNIQMNMKEQIDDEVVNSNDIPMTNIGETVVINSTVVNDTVINGNLVLNPAIRRVVRRHKTQKNPKP